MWVVTFLAGVCVCVYVIGGLLHQHLASAVLLAQPVLLCWSPCTWTVGCCNVNKVSNHQQQRRSLLADGQRGRYQLLSTAENDLSNKGAAQTSTCIPFDVDWIVWALN